METIAGPGGGAATDVIVSLVHEGIGLGSDENVEDRGVLSGEGRLDAGSQAHLPCLRGPW